MLVRITNFRRRRKGHGNVCLGLSLGLVVALAICLLHSFRLHRRQPLREEGFYERYSRVMVERRRRAPDPPPRLPSITMAEYDAANVGFWHPNGSETPDDEPDENVMEGVYDAAQIHKAQMEIYEEEHGKEALEEQLALAIEAGEDEDDEDAQTQPSVKEKATHPLLEDEDILEEDRAGIEDTAYPKTQGGIFKDPISGKSKTYEELFPGEDIDLSKLPKHLLPSKPLDQLTAEERLDIRQKLKHDKYAP
mmetsp:Transcript_3776/g.4995  ORF Transcript_3776/g.4995 Transcript_3776/m.4995 type:complete len:250 (+) Transcript_3776:177-926(+)|eukprot:jgi/Bigna1/86185/estExt_fgenesh1_pg.C_80274